MEIKPSSNSQPLPATATVTATTQSAVSTSLPSNWKVEQLIQAVISKITDKQLFLDIQGIKADTLKPAIANLQPGDILKLQIEQLKPMPQFRIIAIERTLNPELLAHNLKNNLARQFSIDPLFKNISFIANRPALRPAPLPADVNATVREIFRQLPATFNLKTAQQIKTHIQNSGVFIENKIKNSLLAASQNSTPHSKMDIKTLLNQDLGAQLHRLASLIKSQLPPLYSNPNTTGSLTKNNIQAGAQAIPQAVRPESKQSVMVRQNITSRTSTEPANLQNITQRENAMQSFLRQIESSLTHLQQTQQQNLNESQAGRPMWLIELPIKNGQNIDLFELRISQEDEAHIEHEVKKIWRVTLQFDLPGLGVVKSQIKLQDDFVSAIFFSEKPQTQILFQNNIDYLRSRLRANGLNVGNIDIAEKNSLVEDSRFDSPGLDEHA